MHEDDVMTGSLSASGEFFIPDHDPDRYIRLDEECTRPRRGKRVRRDGKVRREFEWTFRDEDGQRWRGVNGGPDKPVAMRRIYQRRRVEAI